MNKQQYIEYLIATPGNYTCTNLADHLTGEAAVSHDAISDYLRREKVTPRGLWEVVQPLVVDDPASYLIVDDSVQDKRYSQKIELVRLQYSGAEHGLVRGIGVINLVHSSAVGDFYPIDYRLYDPAGDGKSKNQHFREMLLRAKHDKQLQARTVLLDSWYASVDNLKLIHRLDMYFVTTLKSNRLISLSKETGYLHLQELEWTAERLQQGVIVKLKEVPFPVRLFKLVAPHGDIDWVITNRLYPTDDSQRPLPVAEVQNENARRWQIEQLHRELKLLTGSDRCQCRKARSQRNHLAYCYLAWLTLKVRAAQVGTSLYQVRANLFSDFLRSQLRNPSLPAYGLT